MVEKVNINTMQIQGLQRVSLLDYPEHIACTVFTSGCNLRCPFCHNGSLVLPERMVPSTITEDEFFDFLKSKINRLEAVCISGGEPLLQPDIEDFIRKVKSMGFLVKLDTNGFFPNKLKHLIQQNIIDYVAVDIKNSPDSYASTAGIQNLNKNKLKESVSYLLSKVVPFEFRTTVVDDFHAESDIEAIAKWIQGDTTYYLQQFTDGEDVIQKGLTPPTDETMTRFLKIARQYVPNTFWRGHETL
jgi:pyruvate formate lyase activating enzyme